MNAISYKCPSCGSPLEFSGAEQKLVCSACGNEYDPEAIEELSGDDGGDSFNWEELRRDGDGEDISGGTEYLCASCGAEVVADAQTAATTCPYCGNVLVLQDKVSGKLRPNAMIPFKVGRDGVADAVRSMCKRKPLLPKHFIDENKLKEIQGVYVPFWLYDCDSDGKMSFNATRTRCWSTKKYNFTETSYFLVKREGGMRFERIPVDGSVRMDNALMDSIEPFDWSELTPFESKYFSGFVADRYDEDPDASLPRAETRVRDSLEEAFRSTVVGYTSVTRRSSSVRLLDTTVKYVMLPVYLIRTKYRDKEYTYAMNGQTGKIVGKLPVSPLRFFAWFAGVMLGTAALLTLLALLFM